MRLTRKQLRKIILEELDRTISEGKCDKESGHKGCIEKDSKGKWRVISNKTGKYWPQTYDTEEDAEDALDAYHA